jgi:hypothetical protein
MPPTAPNSHPHPAPEPGRPDQTLGDLIAQRVAAYTLKISGPDPEIQSIRADYHKFLAILANLLPDPDGTAILNAIDASSCHLETKLQQLTYRRGLLDGVELAALLAERKRERDS